MDTQKIREMVHEYVAEADKIMNGEENYDGADGARKVLFLCGTIIELLNEIDDMELYIEMLMWDFEVAKRSA